MTISFRIFSLSSPALLLNYCSIIPVHSEDWLIWQRKKQKPNWIFLNHRSIRIFFSTHSIRFIFLLIKKTRKRDRHCISSQKCSVISCMKPMAKKFRLKKKLHISGIMLTCRNWEKMKNILFNSIVHRRLRIFRSSRFYWSRL